MSTTDGYFDETLLLNRIARVSAMGANSRLNADNQAWFNTVRAIAENNRWQFGELMRSDKDVTVQGIYTHLCANNAGDYTADNYCTQTCGEPSTNAKNFTMPTPIFDCFTLNENIGRTNEINMDELFMTSRMGVERNLLQLLSQRIISTVIEPNLGVNAYTLGKGTINGTDTEFASAYWNANLVPEIMQTAMRNKFNDYYLLDSGLLYNSMMMANFNRGNANGSGDFAAFGALKYYADTFNIDAVNTPDRVMYIIEPNAIGFMTKSHLPNITQTAPKQVAADEWRWSESSMMFPNISFDVHMTIACDPLTDQKVTTYKYILRWGAWINPTGCDTTNTGILRTVCV